MKFRKFLKDYFTFTKSERNGLIILITIILILVVARLAIPHIRKNITYDFSEFQEEIAEFEKSVSEAEGKIQETGISEKHSELFFFDPNTADREDFENLGLENRVIRNILKYREREGVFRVPEDMRKIYGLDSVEYMRIEPFILIPLNKDAVNNDTTGFATSGLRYDGIKSDGDTTGDGRFSSDDYNTIRAPIPLNISDSAALASIYGIGPVLSARIIKYRNLLGGYISKEQLLEVYGMTHENFENICDFLVIDSAAVIHINLNTNDIGSLLRHPYLNEYQARALISYRDINGRFDNVDEIIKNKLLPVDVYLKIKPYLEVK